MRIHISLVCKGDARNTRHRKIISAEGFDGKDLGIQFTPEGNLHIFIPNGSKYKSYSVTNPEGYTPIRPDHEFFLVKLDLDVELKDPPKMITHQKPE